MVRGDLLATRKCAQAIPCMFSGAVLGLHRNPDHEVQKLLPVARSLRAVRPGREPPDKANQVNPDNSDRSWADDVTGPSCRDSANDRVSKTP